MKKQILVLSTITMSSLMYSQVGVNTQTPQATLDVVGKNTDTTKPDGVIAPRLTGNELKAKDGAYGSNQTGAIVYATSAASPVTTKTANVTAPGYYYFNGTVWTAFSGGGAASGDPTKDAWIDNAANTRVELGTLSNGVTARPAGSEMVISDAGNVGIGITAPANKLVVNGVNAQPSALGTANTSATFRIDGNGSHALDFGTYLNLPWGSYISSHNKASTVALPLVLNPVGGNVGIGTNTPANKLVVNGVNAQPSALGTANTSATFRIDGNGSHALDFGTYLNSPWGSYISSHNKASTVALPLVLNPAGGNVGIGTNTPATSALLDVNVNNLPANGKKGILLPMVGLSGKGDLVTVPNPANGLIVYNTVNAPGNGTDDAVNKDTIYKFNSTLNKWSRILDDAVTLPGSTRISNIFGFLPSGNDTTYLGPSLGSNIRQILYDNVRLENSEIGTFNSSTKEFIAKKTGFFNFQINLAATGPLSGRFRVGVSKQYTGSVPTFADNNSFAFFAERADNIASTEIVNLLSTGILFMNAGEKVIFYTRFLSPTVNTINTESINYDRTSVNSVSITYIEP